MAQGAAASRPTRCFTLKNLQHVSCYEYAKAELTLQPFISYRKLYLSNKSGPKTGLNRRHTGRFYFTDVLKEENIFLHLLATQFLGGGFFLN